MSDHPPPAAWRHAFSQFFRLVRYSVAGLLLIGLVHLVVFFPFTCNWPQFKRDTIRLDLATIEKALQSDRAIRGHYPSTMDGLRGLVERQQFDAIFRDPWGNEYGYLLWGGCPVIWTYGRDGVPGGEGQDADYSNMGAPPPPWILERAAQLPSLPPPVSCPWIMEPRLRSDV